MTTTSGERFKDHAASLFRTLAALPDGTEVICAQFEWDYYEITHTTALGQNTVRVYWSALDRMERGDTP